VLFLVAPAAFQWVHLSLGLIREDDCNDHAFGLTREAIPHVSLIEEVGLLLRHAQK